MITAIIISAIAGATIGYTIAAVLVIGKRAEPEKPPKEPTRLFTVGCLVKWHGRCCEIMSMVDYENGQTYVNIVDSKGTIFRDIEIEELEAVEE